MYSELIPEYFFRNNFKLHLAFNTLASQVLVMVIHRTSGLFSLLPSYVSYGSKSSTVNKLKGQILCTIKS